PTVGQVQGLVASGRDRPLRSGCHGQARVEIVNRYADCREADRWIEHGRVVDAGLDKGEIRHYRRAACLGLTHDDLVWLHLSVPIAVGPDEYCLILPEIAFEIDALWPARTEGVVFQQAAVV